MKVGYARVSTGEQHLDLQIQALKQAGCELLYEDLGVSGSTTSRPGLDQVLSSIKCGDTIVVWRLDRLGRSLRHLIEIFDDFQRHEIDFISLTESIDTTTPGGKLVFHMMGAMSEFERALIAERTKAGMHAAKLNGKSFGRPAKLSQQDVLAAYELLRSGHGKVSDLAAEYDVNPSTLRRNFRKMGLNYR